MTVRVLTGDCRTALTALPEKSVQCVVTSPPYFGLRDYGTGTWEGGDPDCDHARKVVGGPKQVVGSGQQNGHASKADRLARASCGKCGATKVDCQIGLEPTPDEYVAELVAVFREVKRVLRDDGALWLNLGDSYADGGNGGGGSFAQDGIRTALPGTDQNKATRFGKRGAVEGIKSKDLIGIPWMVAFALRADGWYLRSDCIWAKTNPMPESVTDRPTKAHEYVFLLTKSAKYFWDAEAVREPSITNDPRRPYTSAGAWDIDGRPVEMRSGGKPRNEDADVTSRNIRSVWTITTQPFPGSHFATMPPALAERCILAGTSERGACPSCGAPWSRTITKGEPDYAHRAACGADASGGYNGRSTKNHDAAGVQNASDLKRRILDGLRKKTYGWQPTCDCPPAAPVPCVVLDPFAGAGTTLLVADRLGRDSVGIELNPDYAAMIRRRIEGDAGLFAHVAAQ